ncbi:hypothetical protein AAFF_G00173280 [Aldrovandia affinis]|uniref:Uncharacterized protein n=1 Tax=Aldrovandia affinis TaxID=143900 RepID=A0AAD7T047_9TELE|nr:hypothetical protein AAFF_G00173280 [Aldrovandia affinis]
MPVLRLYLDDDADLKPDYRLSRASLQHLIGMLCTHQDHGWGITLRLSHCSSLGISPPGGGNKDRRLNRWPPPKCLIHKGVPLPRPCSGFP